MLNKEQKKILLLIGIIVLIIGAGIFFWMSALKEEDAGKGELVYDSILTAPSSSGSVSEGEGVGVFAFFNIKPNSIFLASLNASKKSLFIITSKEECEKKQRNQSVVIPQDVGYVKGLITPYIIEFDTSKIETYIPNSADFWNPTELCICVLDRDPKNPEKNIVDIKVINFY